MKRQAQTKTKSLRNKTMDRAVYQDRRKVMSCIYSAKALLKRHGFELPRITVRMTDNSAQRPALLGLALTGQCVIWIPEWTLTLSVAALNQVVLHELVHAATGFRHDPSCPLMAHCMSTSNPLSKARAEALFLSYWTHPRSTNGVS